MGKVWTSVMLIVILGAGGLVALMIQDRGNLHRRLMEGELKYKKLEAEIATLRAERERLLSQSRNSTSSSDPSSLEVARATSGATADTKATGAASKAGPADAMAQGRKMWTEMMKNPAMKEVMKQQRAVMLESQYGKLFGRFNLSEEEKTFLKNLLSDRLALDSELGIKLMGDDVTPEQRSAIVKGHQDSKKASDARIRDFLNNEDDYAAFQKWEDTKGERMQVEMGRSLFENAGEALSPEQEQQLVDTMHRLRSSSDGANDFTKPENFDPSRFNDDEIARQLRRLDDQARQVYEAASKFLSPAQLQALRTWQQQMSSMTAASMQMAKAMFQGKKGN
jgi:hypothetical protein